MPHSQGPPQHYPQSQAYSHLNHFHPPGSVTEPQWQKIYASVWW
uniref:Uncharacterized protein n=1 Tax=Anguilla anguilla TaxID=7936 RepID=A0A0E9RB87_ANGAN